ncbi:hypothetical protein H257_15747 [Aphanomyces astaci]|uniref:Uncharacterized protein n=1 Tax=Aphanomyces astaci TaxID=112090 RepID=W4FLE2_APHAT|nr:hypothetical protein H257_15747 [Aphanomyces astaci]ETV68305.1 hypothetical protein H257_15747 [Aphanomyces astaci]|eukprot:XP_009842248.1 hypothetical protein H257_15747 [Aphanomyces astaci]
MGEEMTEVRGARLRGRPVSKGGRKKLPKKFVYAYATYKKRQDVIESFDAVGMASTLDKHFHHLHGVQRETARKKVYAWTKQCEHIKAKALNPRTAHHKCSRELGMGTTLPRGKRKSDWRGGWYQCERMGCQ